MDCILVIWEKMIDRTSFIAGITFGVSSVALIISVLLKHNSHYIYLPLIILSLIGLIYSCIIIMENDKRKE